MRFTRRDVVAIVGAIGIASACVSLGFWQLDRLKQRRAHNVEMERAMRAPAIALETASSAPARLSRVRLRGAPDYRHEVVLTGRTRQGSPGVNLITPFRIAGRDTAVLVNRGWVYSPDASQVDFERWKEADSITISGYVDTLSRRVMAVGAPSRQFRELEQRRLSAQMPYPIAPFYVIASSDAATPSKDAPVRLPEPTLDEGPHKSYAIQWFSFALIALLGTAAYLRATRLRSSKRY